MWRLVLFSLLCYHFQVYSQTNVSEQVSEKLHYGIAGKLSVEFQSFRPKFKMSVAAGIGYDIKTGDLSVFPTLHAGMILFNTGMVGSKLNEPHYRVRSNFFYSLLGSIKLDKRSYSYEERYVPFYHFSDFAANPLQNPYKTSIALGSLWASLEKGIRQKIGVFNLNAFGRIQLHYYNDGGPVLSGFGDKRDRYYTGGLLVSYHGDRHSFVDLIELSYHKYTGYTKNAFDVGELLQIDFLVYSDKEQFAYNQQRWKINATNTESGFALNFSLYDRNRLDFQDRLHFLTNVPYHPDYFKRYRLAYGSGYQYTYLKL